MKKEYVSAFFDDYELPKKFCEPINSWHFRDGQNICFDPDSSPLAWEHYAKVYRDTLDHFYGYDLENPLFFENLYKTRFWRPAGFSYVNVPLSKDNRLFALPKESTSPYTDSNTGWDYYAPTQRLGGDTDFNFNEKKFRFFANLLSGTEYEEQIDTLKLCQKMHHTLVNFSLMPAMGGLQIFKGNCLERPHPDRPEGLDRFDSLITALKDFYENDSNKTSSKQCTSQIFKFLRESKKPPISTKNQDELLKYLNRFCSNNPSDSLRNYCQKVYFIYDQNLLVDLITSGSQPIKDAESVVRYMRLALRYWKMRLDIWG